MVDNRIITPIVAKEIMKKLVATGIPPKEILSEKKLKHVDPEKLVEDILKKFEIAVIDYKKGKRNALNYLVGKCLKESNLAVDPNEIRKIILNKIGE
jgi:aspartyl-tRNA(Asn)/glutamyl-tRNA(Gln) amidotransferase subunit B